MEHKGNQDANSKERRENVAIGFTVGLMFGGLIDVLFFDDLGFATLIGMFAGTLWGYRRSGGDFFMNYPPHILRRMVVAVALFGGSIALSVWLLSLDLAQALKYAIALIPLVTGFHLVVTLGAAIMSLDEIKKKIQLEALGISFGLSLMFFLCCGILEAAGLFQVDWIYFPLGMTVIWFFAKLWTRWKYQGQTA